LFAPLRMRRVEKYVIPNKAFAYAARGFWLRRIRACSAAQFLRDKMMRIPKLGYALVGNSGEITGAWRAEIGWQDWLPDDENAQLRACMAGKKLFGCGGPPQACRSSR
jgi:hypothetical protein